MANNFNSLGKEIKENGFRLTFPRKIIVDILDKAKHHMSADEIYVVLHKKYPRIGFTTVYRTLDLLVRLGLINKFDFGEGKFRYELKTTKSHHHHLICQSCGAVLDCKDFINEETELIARIEERLSRRYTFKINDHLLHFYGLCPVCGRKDKAKGS